MVHAIVINTNGVNTTYGGHIENFISYNNQNIINLGTYPLCTIK